MEKPNVVIDLSRISESEVAALAAEVLALRKRFHDRQAAAGAVIDILYNSLRDAAGQPGCALARCFQTCTYARLPLQYRDAADQLLDLSPSNPNMRCLTLLATRGARTVWNDVATSTNHQAIPLPSVEVVRRAPMIAALLDQIGFSPEHVVTKPDAEEATPISRQNDADGSSIFHIEKAQGSAYIPAQEEFVRPQGVRSVVGMGGALPDGEIFAIILFSRVSISASAAAMFRELGASIQKALAPFTADQTFQSHRTQQNP